MYTQCPDCNIAFRVTADVLKVAAGKVRCGGCGSAFNALEYLSESMPQQPAPKDANEALPELTPEPAQKASSLPESISAEQSAALLKTLDELAGSDIRIEDTGVEWRVLDDDDVGEGASDAVANEANAEALPANDLRADDLVTSISDVDELLEDSPTPVDQFLTETPPQVDSPEIFEHPDDAPALTSVDELRFDDNTPLPDDFDLDDESFFAAAPASEPEELPAEPAVIDEPEPQADLDLSEPDEWTDILGEFDDLAEAGVAPAEAELDELEAPEDDEAEDIDPEPVAADDDTNEPLDMDTQFALQAEAMGIDLSGMHESLDEPEIDDEDDLELLLEDREHKARDIEDLLNEDLVDEFDDAAIDEDPQLELIEDEGDIEDVEDIEMDIDESDAEPPVDERQAFDDELDAEEPVEESENDDFYIPPLTEEEQTINMQIDQDLLALAVEDEDGFASTIVIPGKETETEALDKKKKKKKKEKKAEFDLTDTSAGFETIIMEGEHIRTGPDDEKLALDAAAAASLAGAAAAEREAAMAARRDPRRWGMIGGAVALVLLLTVQVLHQSREALATIPTFNSIASPLYRAIGMPLSPEWDITGWRFEATRHSIGATDEADSPAGGEDVMIFSRVGNNSDKPLPYPIIGVSLTDRYEEPIGGFTLDPADYLPDDLDPRKLVEPGNTFNAVMTIRSPSAEAASFRLRACYRNADGSLRCKDDSFK
jgi:predicted Zn finger-like uncharacterized protein